MSGRCQETKQEHALPFNRFSSFLPMVGERRWGSWPGLGGERESLMTFGVIFWKQKNVKRTEFPIIVIVASHQSGLTKERENTPGNFRCFTSSRVPQLQRSAGPRNLKKFALSCIGGRGVDRGGQKLLSNHTSSSFCRHSSNREWVGGWAGEINGLTEVKMLKFILGLGRSKLLPMHRKTALGII